MLNGAALVAGLWLSWLVAVSCSVSWGGRGRGRCVCVCGFVRLVAFDEVSSLWTIPCCTDLLGCYKRLTEIAAVEARLCWSFPLDLWLIAVSGEL